MKTDEVLDRAFPPEQCDPAWGERSYWPMFGQYNYVPGHTRDATTIDGSGPWLL